MRKALHSSGDYIVNEAGQVFSLKKGDMVELKQTPINSGYMKVNLYFDGKTHCYQVGRLIWECFNGPLNEGETIDHIDGDPLNNNLSNLRALPHSQNKWNSIPKGYTATKSGFMAQITKHGVTTYLGHFKTAAEASAAYWEAKNRLHVIAGQPAHSGRTNAQQ